jgi:hypothetical protein
MRAFLIFLVAMGASVYGFLVALHGLLPSASPEYGVTVSVDQEHGIRDLGAHTFPSHR